MEKGNAGGRTHRMADFISGYISAFSYITAGQPLDYMKVQYQIHSKLPSVYHIYKEIGIMGFYKGSSSLYSMIGTITAVEFFCF